MTILTQNVLISGKTYYLVEDFIDWRGKPTKIYGTLDHEHKGDEAALIDLCFSFESPAKALVNRQVSEVALAFIHKEHLDLDNKADLLRYMKFCQDYEDCLTGARQ